MPKLPKVLRRAGWGVADQVVSSGTNAALSILVARSVDSSGFGAFSVAFIVFTLFVGFSRALNTSPLAIRFASASDADFRRAAAAASGAAFCLGLVGALVCAVAGLLAGGAAGAALLALSLPLPALLVQDSWRYTFFANSRPARAALNDTVWAVGQLATVWLLLMQGVNAVGPFILAWGGAAAVAALVGIYQAGVVPRPGAALGWLREQFALTRYLVAEYGALQAFSQSTMLIISAVASVRRRRLLARRPGAPRAGRAAGDQLEHLRPARVLSSPGSHLTATVDAQGLAAVGGRHGARRGVGAGIPAAA
jgi:O-antigen/teichoic acid export membrane protein